MKAVASRAKNKKLIKCSCGHLPKDHYLQEGACSKCACTWYYPNDKYILSKRGKLGARK